MNHTDARNILGIGQSSGIPVLLYGEEGTGKTGLCRRLFPEARIILDEELKSGGLSLLNSMTKVSKTIIFENLAEETLQTVLPIIMNRTLYGEAVENFFIFTARNDYRNINGFLRVELSLPQPQEWLEWAEREAVHPLVKELVSQHEALTKFRTKDIETLSKLLNIGVPTELLETMVAPLVGHNPEIMAAIQAGYDDTLDFEKVISLGNTEFINRIKQTSSDNIDKFNETLLQEIRFDESIITKEKLVAYISSMDSRKSVELLSGLLESEASYGYLNELLDDTGIRQKIDAALGL